MVVCEAAGFDVIIVETVGVGQSEITVRSMVDLFLLLQIAGAGDELQGIKKGVMETTETRRKSRRAKNKGEEPKNKNFLIFAFDVFSFVFPLCLKCLCA